MSDDILLNEDTGSEDTQTASEEQGNAETTENVTNEQPDVNVDIPEKFKGKSLEEVAKSAIESEKMQTRTAEERNLLKKQLDEMQKQIKSIQKQSQKNDVPDTATQETAKKEFVTRLNKALKGDNPAEVVLGLLGKMAENMKSAPQTADPTFQEIKEEKLLEKNLVTLNDPLAVKHKEDIRKIMVEKNFPADNPDSVEFAWAKWKSDNITTYFEEVSALNKANTNETEGGKTVTTHETAKDTSNSADTENVSKLTEDDKKHVSTAIQRGTFKDVNEYRNFEKEYNKLPTGGYFGGKIISDREPEVQNK